MPLLQPTKDLLGFLHRNPAIRTQIKAAPNKTLLYAGSVIKPAWKDIIDMKAANPEMRDKVILPDVLERILLTGQPFPNLLAWVKSIDALSPPAPWKDNGFIAWRAVSGIFAANAVGAVSFYVGSPVSKATKVFAATEVSVLLKNPNIDHVTRDVLGYYDRCIKSGNPNISFGLIHG